MSETVLIDAATVAAGDPSAVVAFKLVAPEVDFRVVCDNAYSVTFYVGNTAFTSTTGSGVADLDGYGGAHAATTGTVYRIDCGSYDYAAAVVTNTGADAAAVTVAAGWDLVAEAPSALFTVAEARAFDKAQLASDTDYPDAVISEKETQIHEFLHSTCGVWFCPVTTTDEYHDGDGSDSLILLEPLVTSITAASYRTAGTSTWTALTATQLGQLQLSDTGMVTWEYGTFTKGKRNWKFTYVAGHTTVPEQVKDAALRIVVTELPATNVPFSAESYEGGGMNYSFNLGDGYGGNYHRIPEVRRTIGLFTRKLPGII